jgi:hypothetical protein
VAGVLNLGVSPQRLVAAAKRSLLASGGAVFEHTSLESLTVHDNAVRLQMAPGGGVASLNARLVVDSLGHGSPITRQARRGRKPDGVCLVVGTCARGFEENSAADVIVTTAPIERIGELEQQAFWEAFPAGSGPTDRTTYLFSYLDADPGRLSLTQFMDSYWPALERYQGVDVDKLQLLRVLFGVFPTYRDSPLQLPFDRMLAVGDASGVQSPLSFGGFGALCRNLGRYTDSITGAVELDLLDRRSLAAVNSYLPNLSGAWLFSRAMSAPRGTRPAPSFVNELLSTNFATMQRLGDAVLLPFLRDVPNFPGLTATLLGMMTSNARLIPSILIHCGPAAILNWLVHFTALGMYSLLYLAFRSVPLGWLPPKARWRAQRMLEAWQFGAGLDFELPSAK